MPKSVINSHISIFLLLRHSGSITETE